MLTRDQKLSLLGAFITISVTSIGFAIGGTLGASVIGGVGINLTSNLIEGGCLTLKERWINSRNGILNHDVQRVLIDARLPGEAFQQQFVEGLNKNQTYLEILAENTQQIAQDVKTLRYEFRNLATRRKEDTVNKAGLQLQLSSIRQGMLIADSKQELRILLYQVEELLEYNAYNAETRLLKEQIETALRSRELTLAPALTNRVQFKTGPLFAGLSVLIVITSLFASAIYFRVQRRPEPLAIEANSVNSIWERRPGLTYWQERVEMRKGYWSPEMREAFDRSNHALDVAIEESMRDLRSNPHDEFSEEMLNSLISDKLALLKEFAGLGLARQLRDQAKSFSTLTDSTDECSAAKPCLPLSIKHFESQDSGQSKGLE